MNILKNLPHPYWLCLISSGLSIFMTSLLFIMWIEMKSLHIHLLEIKNESYVKKMIKIKTEELDKELDKDVVEDEVDDEADDYLDGDLEEYLKDF